MCECETDVGIAFRRPIETNGTQGGHWLYSGAGGGSYTQNFYPFNTNKGVYETFGIVGRRDNSFSLTGVTHASLCTEMAIANASQGTAVIGLERGSRPFLAYYLNNTKAAKYATTLTGAPMGTSDYRNLVYQMGGETAINTAGPMVVGDLILFNRAITATEMTQLNAYLNAKWGLSYS